MEFKVLLLILIVSIPVVQASLDRNDLEEKKRTPLSSKICHWVIKGGVMVASYAFIKTVVLPAVGITNAGIAAGSIAEKIYKAMVTAKGLIVTKGGFADAFLMKYATKYGLSVTISMAGKIYNTIDPYLDMLATYICD
ncbi:uncharacterized protein LOC133180495 [Saccostrea echinata]|uniref:uncharacterized protein LOC133180495 n=1 Tax=Saccostrea echinata TaxID=191078 RepID=UPI002A825677|nr:uncharacterized protein LOC133180495 [Saccostrea echinata]